MKYLDKQLELWSTELNDSVKIANEDTAKLATLISKDVRLLKLEHKKEILESSPVDIKHKYEELIAFQNFMELSNKNNKVPAYVRAQLIVQNYICFVYLNDSCFKILYKYLPSGSASKKCYKFLINNPIRAFRNSIAHSNWCYNSDFSGIIYWARKGSDPKEPLSQYEVTNKELNFWQTLARCVAYVSYEILYNES